MNLTRLREMSKSETNGIQLIMLICETLVILLVFNAGSYFSTTTYSKSIDSVGIILTIFLLLWIWVHIKIYGYKGVDLGLCFGSISKKQWKAIVIFCLAFYSLAFVIETLFPSEMKGEITLIRLLLAAIFTLTFGPVFEELLFRGYLFTRSQDTFQMSRRVFLSFKVPFASIFSGVAWGFWHLPTPIILWYFNDSMIEIYQSLFGFVLLASMIGILLCEIKRKTKSLIPGMILHLVGNSAFILGMAMKM